MQQDTLPDFDSVCQIVGKLFLESQLHVRRIQVATSESVAKLNQQLQEERQKRIQAENELRKMQCGNG